MPRTARIAPGSWAYHAMNRGCGRCTLFDTAKDFAAFERVIDYALERHRTRILAYCVMPNHWHFVLWPEADGELTGFLRSLTHTHTQRWHAFRHTAGTGHLYQGRFKSFPIQEDGHLLDVLRYVERNPLRANLVERAEQWQWSSLWRRERGSEKERSVLSEWPVPRPGDWVEQVNRAETPAELEALRRSVRRGSPFGEATWVVETARALRLERTLRPPGRPPATPKTLGVPAG
jgi:putative transposase